MGPSLRSPRRWIPPLVVLACAIAPAGSPATPVAGKLVDVGPVENSKPASIKCPGETAFAKVVAPRQVAVGCEVDLGNGWISITTARADGTPQTGTFSGTRVHFRITQEGDTGVVTEIPPYFCRGPSGFFADTQGLFRMVGRYGSATGQTAQWHMDDGCLVETTFAAGEGTLEIRDFPARKTVQLRPERRYTAGVKSDCRNLVAMPPRSDYAAINITVSGISCARAKSVLIGWIKRLPRYNGSKTKRFPVASGGWTFIARAVDQFRSDATRGVAAIAFALITTTYAKQPRN